ncbi:NUDIX hydrolase [Patescibacteria group bacterium]
MDKRPIFRREIVDLPDLKFIQVAIHRFRLPNGEEGQWNSMYFPEEITDVATVAMTPQGKIVLVRMFRFAIADWSTELPGGMTGPGEDFATAARRELLEETGYDTREPFEELFRIYSYPGRLNTPAVIFLARNCERVQDPQLDDVEGFTGLEAIEQSPDEIMRNIFSGNPTYSLLISRAMICLFGRGIVQIEA